MPILSPIGRKQTRIRFIVWSIYTLLTLGAATMVYPFLLMLSGSTKTAVDTPETSIVPAYLIDDTALYRKYTEGFFNENIASMQNAYGEAESLFSRLQPPSETSPLLKDWREFLAASDFDSPSFVLGYLYCQFSQGASPFNLVKFRHQLLRAEGGIEGVNLRYGTSFPSASAFIVIPPNYLNRFVEKPESAYLKSLEEFSRQQPGKWRYYVSIANYFRNYLQAKYGKKISDYNTAKKTAFTQWSEVPAGPSAESCRPWGRTDFDEFVRLIVNPVFLTLDSSASSSYHDYLSKKYNGDISAFNARHGTQLTAFSQAVLHPTMPQAGIAKSDWKGFVEGYQDPDSGNIISCPLDAIRLTGPDFTFREYLQKKYGEISSLNQALKTDFSSWEVVPMPQNSSQYQDFLELRGWLRWQFTIRNYVDVWNYIAVNGRGLVNTIIYCGLAILAALTVDPIAAYALSRFKPRRTYQILLFLMMTMAFPTMVTQIPVFLLLRDLGMLNTFWALVLPGIANGYHIFLLKGFFDSLPRELYESAEIDGASELTIFWNITLALSKPILAVIALGAFTSAYSAFMFALLLCQDPGMWTLMVWLYQLQQTSGQGIVFASLILAAIPTLIVFIACQNVIMRGIVVPVEK